MSSTVFAQYRVRANITIADADALGTGEARLEIRTNNIPRISISNITDGNFDSPLLSRRQEFAQSFSGLFPSQVQFTSFTLGVSIAPAGDPIINPCLFGSITNTITTNGQLFLGPFDGSGNNTTYFDCDEIIESGEQFFQVWELKDLLQPTNNTPCIDDTLFLNPLNFNPSIAGVRFSINSSNVNNVLHSFPSLVGSTSVNINEIPGITNGDILRLRLDYGDGVFSNIVTYTIIDCSPNIVNIDTQSTSCVYNDDGGFTVTFDRSLMPNESLANLNVTTPGPNGVFNDPDDPNDDDILLAPPVNGPVVYDGNTLQYTWPNPLEIGVYRLRYQAGITGSGSLSSVVASGDIVITSPPPLEYGVGFSDIQCFDANDGEITITINPSNNGSIGTPSYHYELNGVTTNFIGNSVTIMGLGTGPHVLKIFDSNDCTERE